MKDDEDLMKDLESSSLMPLVKIGNYKIPRVILGHLPFVGESYQGKIMNIKYSKKFQDINKIVEILTKAAELGITVVSAPTMNEGESARRFLKAVEKTSKDIGDKLSLIICLRLPLHIKGEQIDDYRRWLTYYQIEKRYGEEQILRRYLSDPILQVREDWEFKLLKYMKNCRPYSNEFKKVEIDYDKIKNCFLGMEHMDVTFIELGSETDFLSIGNRLDLLSDLTDWLFDNYGYQCLLGSHHSGITILALENSKINFNGYVTPINKLGVMMFPTQKMSEIAIQRCCRPVIAIKPFAGGRIPPKPALSYVYNTLNASACMIGVGSKSELMKDSEAALKILSGEKYETN